MRLPAVALCAVLLTACTSDGGKDRAPTPTVSAGAVTHWVPSDLSGGFRTPSGNITCELSDSSVNCHAKQKPWKGEPRQGDCANWDTAIALGGGGGAYLQGRCLYDDDLVPAEGVLAYGHAIEMGEIRCLSLQSGLECAVIGRAGQGFTVSRSSYSLRSRTAWLNARPAQTPPSTGVTVVPAGFSGGFTRYSLGLTCDISSGGAHCLARADGWQPPPASEPCTDGDVSTEVLLDGRGLGHAFLDCRTDSLAGGRALPFGRGLRIGDVQCLSRERDLRCENLRTRHGFEVSPESFRGF